MLVDAHQERLMGRRLYVGNLAWTVTDQDLQDVFAEAGKVDSSQVIIDRATNRSRGFGFVEMATDDSAEAAIKKLNGRDIKGRPIRVNEAQARSGGGGGGGGGERRGGRDR
jgi:RNA recognition motif-containing protein